MGFGMSPYLASISCSFFWSADGAAVEISQTEHFDLGPVLLVGLRDLRLPPWCVMRSAKGKRPLRGITLNPRVQIIEIVRSRGRTNLMVGLPGFTAPAVV